MSSFTLLAAEPIRVGLHLSAPWSFYNANSELDGIEYRLVSRIFQLAAVPVVYELHSYSRLLKQFNDKKLDCASPVAMAIEGAFYTEAYLPFQDVVASKHDAPFNIAQLADLKHKRIVAYQQASQVLGAEFREAISTANYIELAEREVQLELLFSDRVDLVVGERRVLQYLAATLAPAYSLRTYALFAEKSYPAACWQPELVQLFNRELLKMQQSGELAAILQRFDEIPLAIGTK
ncbi:substrate-binding periplasmic protein [Rheinheimera maricola]|uniref:Transporter substrate-binding domain-containing protein n=1 Tax=Rheinheimera maricola TaxID=2793282 RepID=A0ABS7XD64_9GAMM|nr:transporter substrate-binding domain-containing protein [Rheinheimera maricola]MBZ9613503.1 transporter substrate-binding domain-containing protein [Rheinheimera maricola]